MPKLRPESVRLVPAVVGKLGRKMFVETGASKVKADDRQPTLAETVSATSWAVPAPLWGVHANEVAETQELVMHTGLPRLTVPDTSDIGPKFKPATVKASPIDVAALRGDALVMTGASNESANDDEPIEFAIVTNNESCRPLPIGTRHESLVDDVHVTVAQLVMPSRTLAVGE